MFLKNEDEIAKKYFADWLLIPSFLSSDSIPDKILSEGASDIDVLRKEAEACTACRLCETRKSVVFGEGKSDRPLIAFVGEGPGEEEDLSGRPFVGKAGILLAGAIEKGMKLRRSDVYICNVVKCRPPDNRNPLPDEISACEGFLYRQLKLIQPKIIVTLGSPAQKTLTKIDQGITKLRGKWLDWEGIKVMPTFHPAYILRNPESKKEFWDDLKLVMEVLGI